MKITDDIYVRILDMPAGIYAFTVKDEEGNFNIYLNAKLCDMHRYISYKHEIEHIVRGDWKSPLPVWLIEEIVRGTTA